jgi:hypothetical protein
MILANWPIFGVVVAPIVPLMGLACLGCAGLRALLRQRGPMRRIWHPALFDISLYLIVLSLLVLAAAAWDAHV